ncbi:ABC transporter ATP-binding protein [Kitasatospora sp. CB01950]|uniref:ABC transporter ATP-binding protein n=1 Tax=Kitasatospora sp. CB01950 TaxID=1703930 RepID=UPI00093AE92C|nr:ABC transporter ATP-binding protein [Kitasatospora sp. CB01950]OKJ17395.1 ABC transporter ATP-binding protein [Kitasatospora sp. CB01950]
MTPVLEAVGLGKRYGRRSALADVELSVPAGRVVGLVGPNGAGKSTLLQLACGLIAPTAGRIRVHGAEPGVRPDHLARVGYVAQDTPVYPDLTVAEHLRLGARLNPRWDAALAERRLARSELDPRQKAGRLSGGQRAQLALTVAAAKRPDLLILDEPAAALDPLARHAFLDHLMESVTELGATAVLSSHALPDVARVCDHLVVLARGRVQLHGDIGPLLARHARVTGRPADLDALPSAVTVLTRTEPSDGGPATALVRTEHPLPDGPWAVTAPDLEELVLAQLARAENARRPAARPEARR